MLLVGSSPGSQLLLGEVGYLQCHKKRNFLSLMWDDEIFKQVYFYGMKPLSIQGPLSLCPTKGKVPFCFHQGLENIESTPKPPLGLKWIRKDSLE